VETRRRSLEDMAIDWSGKRVLLTGHTGFKGSWLSLWLQRKGADLCGFSLEPPTEVNLFGDARVATEMRSVTGDIRDEARLREVFREHRPEIVFHLAAQPLVRESYVDPVGTYATNVLGTANVLDAARHTPDVRAIVVATTDKCYENRGWDWPYREIDRLGGYDPYSSSKACAEFVVSSYRNSFFHPAAYSQHGVAIASVRAGNVIGGGDWASDRLVPDIMRAFQAGRPVFIRNPHAIRPWQHVLEPLRGYIAVAESLYENGTTDGEAWNFGPEQADAQPVVWMVQKLAEYWGGDVRWEVDAGIHPHEAHILQLDWSKAKRRLRWSPAFNLNDALAATADWYKLQSKDVDMREFTLQQIQSYEARCRALSASNSAELPNT